MLYYCRMKNSILTCLFWTLLMAVPVALKAQEQPSLFYYLPEGKFDPAVPTPAAYLGFEVGQWHTSHDQLLGYMRELARTSKRISLKEYGRSHENRPLICLTITHPDQLGKADDIKKQRRALADPDPTQQPDPATQPAVLYMGHSIHGNETSGANAAILVAYWLAAAQGPEVETMLKNTVILLDPCFNPDGMQRFSSWVNSRRMKSLQTDPANDEFNEHWPGGRFNHYWFDLNRDWLVMQQPESEGRVRIFQEWLPNVLTDHHEMGSNSTFFFQPGVASRVNPVTPARNQQLTGEIARYHAKALSEKGILFYSGENFDDFYYGKGSTYPDANGCVGILFEQGSSRGSGQETTNGLLTFPYSIRNQVITAFSTLKAVTEKRAELNTYLRDFYRENLADARKSNIKAYIMQAPGADEAGLNELSHRILAIHRIQAYALNSDVTVDGKTFKAGKAVVIPTEQSQYRLIRGIFERFTTFSDSIFYDISAWTLPDAFGLEWAALDSRFNANLKQLQLLTGPKAFTPAPARDTLEYAWIIPADAQGLPELLVRLHQQRYKVKVAKKEFETAGRTFQPGTLVINRDRQSGNFASLKRLLDQSPAAKDYLLVSNGMTDKGPWLGSSNFVNCSAPRVLMVTGEGVNALDAGSIWHYLDTRLGLPPVLVESDRLANLSLDKYNVIILADGRYNNLPTEKIKEFVSKGGTLITTGNAAKWVKTAGLANVDLREIPKITPAERHDVAFNCLDDLKAARTMPGAIFQANPDPTHPLCYGYKKQPIALFLSDPLYLETNGGTAQCPLQLTEKPLLAGYIHPTQLPTTSSAGAAVVNTLGSGRIISFAADPNFRSFWWGTQRLMGNAVLFGSAM